MVLFAYVLCLCILALSRIPRYDLGRQNPAFSRGFCHNYCGGQGSVSAGLRARQHQVGHHRSRIKRAEPLSTIGVARPGYAPPPCGAFKAVEDVKAVPIDVEDPTKIVQIGADLNPK
jgi:hypothetical protein